MHLYHLTIQQATGVKQAVSGSFSAENAHEIIMNHGGILSLYELREETGELNCKYTKEAFSIVREIMPFRMLGDTRDLLVVASDSGRIVVLDYNVANDKFEVQHCETYGKSGCRRVVAGEYLAGDPKGRAIMIAAVERQKFIYLLNRDKAGNPCISSPIEAHKNGTVTYTIVGLDSGFENPQFASLEVEYDNPTVKQLVVYEMDLGLNHAVRKSGDEVDITSNLLLSVPGDPDGPGGVIICSQGSITYINWAKKDSKIALPQRKSNQTEQYIIAHTFQKISANEFFWLLQTESGDIFKLEIDSKQALLASYFDTIFPCRSLCFLSCGYMLAAAETGDHAMYQFAGIGDGETIQSKRQQLVLFDPRKLKNLHYLNQIDNLNPVNDMIVSDLANEGNSQVYILSGKESRGALRVLRHGISVKEAAEAKLAGRPTAIWSLRHPDGTSYILLSFLNATLILKVAETIKEVGNSPFESSKSTLHADIMEEGLVIQVLKYEVRIVSDFGIDAWEPPGMITWATSNSRQLVIAVQGGICVYFEMESSGQLAESGRKEMEHEVICLAVAPVPEGRVRSRFVAVGWFDNSVRILSLDPDTVLIRLSTQALPESQPASVRLTTMGLPSNSVSYLYVGLENGIMLRTVVDDITGQLTDTRAKTLGQRSVKLFSIQVEGHPAICAVSSRVWISYTHMSKDLTNPLWYNQVDAVAHFNSDSIQGLAVIQDTMFKVVTLEKLGVVFNSKIVNLPEATPKRMDINPETRSLFVLQSDYYGNGIWKCEVNAYNAQNDRIVPVLDQPDVNEVFTSAYFYQHPNNVNYYIVGSATNLTLDPIAYETWFLSVYAVEEDDLALLHRTQTESPSYAVTAYDHRLLVGVGSILRLYEIGKSKLLRKAEYRFPKTITQIAVKEQRIFVAAASLSINVLCLDPDSGQFVLLADDPMVKWPASMTVLDPETVAVVDKFENFSVLRIPADFNEDLRQEPSRFELGRINSAYYKLDQLAHFYLGDMAVKLQRSCLSDSGQELLVYATSMGAIGAMLPIISRDDLEFLVHLEMFIRQEAPSIWGREHIQYRSYYTPVKEVVDGDLCEDFGKLSPELQKSIADQIERPVTEILKKLDELRNKIL